MKRAKWTPWLFIAPALIPYLILFVYPAFDSLHQSCYAWNGFTPQRVAVGLANFRKLFRLDHFYDALFHNFIIFSLGGTLLFVLGLTFAATLAARKTPRGAKFLRSVLFFPSIISAVGIGLLWRQVLDVKSGPVNQLLSMLGIKPIEWLGSSLGLYSCIGIIVWAALGTYLIIFLAGIQRIPPSYIEAAEVDGAGPISTFWNVTLPLLKDVLITALTLWFIGSLQVFGLLQSLMLDVESRAPQLSVISTYQYSIAFSTRDNVYEMGLGAAMAVVLSLLTLGGASLLNRLRS